MFCIHHQYKSHSDIMWPLEHTHICLPMSGWKLHYLKTALNNYCYPITHKSKCHYKLYAFPFCQRKARETHTQSWLSLICVVDIADFFIYYTIVSDRTSFAERYTIVIKPTKQRVGKYPVPSIVHFSFIETRMLFIWWDVSQMLCCYCGTVDCTLFAYFYLGWNALTGDFFACTLQYLMLMKV